MTSRQQPRPIFVVFVCTVLSASLACSTTRMMSRPPSDADRAELTARESNDWVIDYRRVLPKEVWVAARAEGVAAGERVTADDFPFDEDAKKPHLNGNLLQFTSVSGRPREVPIEALRSIQVDVRHGRGALEGGGLGLLAGAGVGALSGFLAGDDPRWPPSEGWRFTAGQKAIFGALAGALLGLGVGLLVGAIVGHREIIEFPEAGQSESSR